MIDNGHRSGDLFRLDGRVALVTGGNRGIGRAVAVTLAAAGADIVVTSRSGTAEETSDAVCDVGRDCGVLPADFSPEANFTQDAAEQLVRDAVAQHGRLDIVVNSAGINKRAPVLDMTMADWDAVLHVNLRSAWVLSQAAARHMASRKYGRIVNLASLLSFQGGWTAPAYAAAKHAIVGMTQAMCNELAGFGIGVNAVAPGYVATEMNTALMEDPMRCRDILARIPAGRWATPEDLAGSVVFLASPASSYIHGHVLVVDGGWMAR